MRTKQVSGKFLFGVVLALLLVAVIIGMISGIRSGDLSEGVSVSFLTLSLEVIVYSIGTVTGFIPKLKIKETEHE